jgi:hypothetical protein
MCALTHALPESQHRLPAGKKYLKIISTSACVLVIFFSTGFNVSAAFGSETRMAAYGFLTLYLYNASSADVQIRPERENGKERV